MGIILLAVFIGVPLLEIAVFIEVGGLLGLWPTLIIVILTAVAGTQLLRMQGIATLGRIRTQLDRGQIPTTELFDGACLLVAGALLLTPGFVTDAGGMLLFVPQVRAYLRHMVAKRAAASASARVWVDGQEVTENPDVIDGDAVEIDEGPDTRPTRNKPDGSPPRLKP